jgi:uncharacterized protein YbbC (DUF1343 family)
MLEYNTNYSVGRGTDAPFEQVGADWIDGTALAQRLNGRLIPGVRVYATRFRPAASNFKGKTIPGVRFVLTDRESFDSTRLGLELAVALRDLFPGHLDFDKCATLIGNGEVIRGLKNGRDATTLWMLTQAQAAAFADRRKPYLLY